MPTVFSESRSESLMIWVQGYLIADVSKYQPEVCKSEKSKILKKIHKVALGKLITNPINILDVRGVIGFAALGPGFTCPRRCVTKKSF